MRVERFDCSCTTVSDDGDCHMGSWTPARYVPAERSASATFDAVKDDYASSCVLLTLGQPSAAVYDSEAALTCTKPVIQMSTV